MQPLTFRFTVRTLMVAVLVSAAVFGAARLKLDLDRAAVDAQAVATRKDLEAKDAVNTAARRTWEYKQEAYRFRVSARADPAPIPIPPDADADEPSLTETDCHVLSAFTKILAEDPEFNPSQRDGKELILLQETARPGQLSWFGDRIDENLSAGLEASWNKRNSKNAVSLRDFTPSVPTVRVLEFDPNQYRRYAFQGRFPGSRGYLIVSLPGYSKDGRTAGISFCGGPGDLHGGPSGLFVFSYRDGAWRLAWHSIGYPM